MAYDSLLWDLSSNSPLSNWDGHVCAESIQDASFVGRDFMFYWLSPRFTTNIVSFNKDKTKQKTSWPQSICELYRPSYLRLLAKLVPTFCGKRVPRGQHDESPRLYSRLSRPGLPTKTEQTEIWYNEMKSNKWGYLEDRNLIFIFRYWIPRICREK
jgi:hypothetical protein